MPTQENEREQLHSGRFSVIPALALDDPHLTPALLRLLCLLGTHGDRYGYCRPKLRTLAGRLGNISQQAVSKNLQQLKKLGWIEITPQYGADGRQMVNHYRILFDHQPKNIVLVEGGQLPEVEGGQLPEVEGGQLPEVEALNVPYERPILTLPTAAALSISPREEVNGVAHAAAAVWNDNILQQTAEQVRQRLGMPLRNLTGIADILRQYPEAPAYFIAQAASCAEKLRMRPLRLAHFQTWLERSEIARQRAEQDGKNHAHHDEHQPTDEARRRAARDAQAERDRLLDAAEERFMETLRQQTNG